MTKDEILKKISELKNKLKQNQYLIEQKDVISSACKVAINSAYGAISSRMNPIGDDDIANAITVTGSNSIQYVNKLAIEFVRLQRREYILKAIEEIDNELKVI